MTTQKLKRLVAKNRAAIVIALGLILLLLTASYAVGYYRILAPHIPGRSVRNVAMIADWMTLDYISRTYAVPLPLLLDTVGVTSQQASHQSLRQIAKSQRLDPQVLITRIRQTIIRYKGVSQYKISTPL